MKYDVEVAEHADAEANFAFKWIEVNSSPTKAIAWFNGLVDAVDTLCTFPERCPIAPESEDVGREIRHLIYGNYRIIFAIEEQKVFILHIRHGKQQYLTSDEF